MVWSLVYSSLVSISNGIKDGTIQNPHKLPQNLRQRVLNTVLQRRMINEPNCMALLSSVQFLNGMESLSTEHGGYEMVFLERLETSMATVLSNGGTVGAGITKLNLSVYGCQMWPSSWPQVMKASSYPMVARLIAQCPNTTSLTLCGIKSTYPLTGENSPGPRIFYSPWFPSALNKDDVCNSVTENLVELSLRNLGKILSSDSPMINFKQLTTLKLHNCSLQFDIWPEFLSNIPTLVNLHMIDVKGVGKGDDSYDSPNHDDAYGLDWILPFSMPHLQSLEVVSINNYKFILECNKAFVDNLTGCQKIRRVHLTLDQNSTDDDNLLRLASMNIDLRVKAQFSDLNLQIVNRKPRKCVSAALDSSSRFKIVRLFNQRMDSFILYAGHTWFGPEYTTALEDAIDSCSNLTRFTLLIPTKSYHHDATEIDHDDKNRVNVALLQFFGNWDRAILLKDLILLGKFDESIFLAAFDCCLNLDRLAISTCTAVRDQHLIDWVSNGGGRLKYLQVLSCPNVTSEGIIPVMAMSGERLLHICICPNQVNGEGRNWKTMLNSICPNAKTW